MFDKYQLALFVFLLGKKLLLMSLLSFLSFVIFNSNSVGSIFAQNLLLTVHDNSCYFLALTDDADFNQLNAEHRQEAQVRRLWVWIEDGQVNNISGEIGGSIEYLTRGCTEVNVLVQDLLWKQGTMTECE